jgi:hypothetical protein
LTRAIEKRWSFSSFQKGDVAPVKKPLTGMMLFVRHVVERWSV